MTSVAPCSAAGFTADVLGVLAEATVPLIVGVALVLLPLRRRAA